MANSLIHPEPQLRLELATPGITWVDRLRRGIWPKPMVFWAVVFYIALFIIRPWEQLFPELAAFRFERLAVIFVGLIVLLRRGPLVRFDAQNVTMLCLFVAVYASGRNAWDTTVSMEEVTEFFGFTLIFFFIQKAVKTPYQLIFLVASYLMLTTAYTGKAIWEYAFNGAKLNMMGVDRLAGIEYTYGHPNTFGTTMLCSLPFGVLFYRIRDQFCQTWPRRMQWLFKWAVIGHITICILGVLLTRSRSTTVGLVVFAGLLIMHQRGFMKKVKWSMLAMLVFVIGFAVSPSDIKLRMQSLWDSSIEHKHNMGGANASAEGRLEGLYAGLEIFDRFPATGVGIGCFATYRGMYVDEIALDAHNLPGELLGEIGFFGTLAFTAFYLVHFITLRKLLRLGKEHESLTGDKTYYWLGLGLFDGMLLLMFSGVSGHTLQQYQWYFYASFAITAFYFVRQEVVTARSQAIEDEEMSVYDSETEFA